jgi:hypothetical protein
VTRGSAVVTRGSAVVTRGSAVVTRGSAVVTRGSAVVTPGSAVVTPGSAVVARAPTPSTRFRGTAPPHFPATAFFFPTLGGEEDPPATRGQPIARACAGLCRFRVDFTAGGGA